MVDTAGAAPQLYKEECLEYIVSHCFSIIIFDGVGPGHYGIDHTAHAQEDRYATEYRTIS